MAQSGGRQLALGKPGQPRFRKLGEFQICKWGWGQVGTTLQERITSAWKEGSRTQEFFSGRAAGPRSRVHILVRDVYSSLSFLLGSQQGHWYTQFSKVEKQPVLHMVRQEVARHT